MSVGYPPFISAFGSLPKIFDKMRELDAPAQFTHEVLFKMGFGADGLRPVVPILKRMRLIDAEGVPTELYHRFLSPAESNRALEAGIRIAYAPILAIDPDAVGKDRKVVAVSVSELAGLPANHPTVRAVAGTFETLCTLAGCPPPQPPKVERAQPRKVSVKERRPSAYA